MKKIVLTLLTLVSVSAVAQTTFPESMNSAYDKKHEIRVGAIKLLSGHSLELSYERVKDKNQGYGAHFLVGFGDGEDVLNQNISIAPYYRFYFSQSQEYGAKGMFVEGFADLYSGTEYVYSNSYTVDPYGYYYYNQNKENFTDLALGLAIGWKKVNTIGFVFELKAGYGKNLIQQNTNASGVFKGDISIGYRFN